MKYKIDGDWFIVENAIDIQILNRLLMQAQRRRKVKCAEPLACQLVHVADGSETAPMPKIELTAVTGGRFQDEHCTGVGSMAMLHGMNATLEAIQHWRRMRSVQSHATPYHPVAQFLKRELDTKWALDLLALAAAVPDCPALDGLDVGPDLAEAKRLATHEAIESLDAVGPGCRQASGAWSSDRRRLPA